jgi:2-keto-4-pentenoate hydratase/2-oxohepta-3-ene-1,7-dioic acid hydratase in catechol pathway
MHLVTFERREPEQSEAVSDHSMGDMALRGQGIETLEEGASGSRRLGAVLRTGPHAGHVVDLNRALAVRLAEEDAGAPEAEANSLIPHDMLAFLAEGARARSAAESALEFARAALESFDGPDLIRAGVVEPRGRVRLCAPVPRPGKLIGVSGNYAAHAAERGADAPPEEPTLFLKAPSSVIGPADDIQLPAASHEVDFEGELAVVVGKRLREIAPSHALAGVAGYSVANDVTARDFQNVRGQHFIGKSCDTFAPMGPYLVTADEIPDPQDLELTTRVTGEVMQSARTKEMIFPVAELLAFASRLMTLEPGDVLLTGTPSGVGAARTPPRWLQDGDVVEIAIESLGRLHNYVRRPPR